MPLLPLKNPMGLFNGKVRISLKNVTHHWGRFHSDRANMIREDSHGSQAAMTLQTIIWRIEDYHPMIEAGLLEDRRVELLRG